jgi:hypothetical protein
MTNQEMAEVLRTLGRVRTIGYLSRLRRSDLESIAVSRGVQVSATDRPAEIADRVVTHVTARAERLARREQSRAGRSRR